MFLAKTIICNRNFILLSNHGNDASKADTIYVFETTIGSAVKLEESVSLNVASKLAEASFDTTKFLEAGKVMDRGGFTKAGRALMKHGYREDSVFPKPIGNPAKVNAHGQKILEELLYHPEKKS